jgi:hypothetical protein
MDLSEVALPMNPTLFSSICGFVQLQCFEIAHAFSNELNTCFPSQELMNAFGVVYPRYSVALDSKASFPLHFEAIMSFYCVPHKTFNFELLVVSPLDKLKLEFQVSLFKTTILHNASKILKKDGKELTI